MNKKNVAFLIIVGIFMTTNIAFAYENYQKRNIFNKVTDWSSTMGKPSTTRQSIVDQRVQKRAAKREADETYRRKKHQLTQSYHSEILSISDQNDRPEVMAMKLKKAAAEHKRKLRDLKAEIISIKSTNNY